MKEKLKQIKWGIVGVGDVCEQKSAPAMQIIPDSSIEIVMRRDEKKLVDYAKRHQISSWTTDADEVINHPEVNAIYIATPPAFHAKYAIAAAKAGKAVYVEKPMATSYDECVQMSEACQKAQVPLFVAYYRRALPHFLKVKELIESGAIGEIRFVKIDLHQPLNPDIVAAGSDWRVVPEISGGGYFYDLGSHQLDLLDFILGPVKSGKGYSLNQAKKYLAEDIVLGIFEFETGVLGTGSWCFSVDPTAEKDRVTIYGSDGHIDFATFGPSDVILKTSKAQETFTFDMPTHIQQPLIEQVVNELRGKGKCVSTGISAARANRMMECLGNQVEKS